MAAAFLLNQLQNAAHVLLVGQDLGEDDGLLDLLDVGGIGPARWIVHLNNLAIGKRDVVADTRRGGDEVERVFALQPLLNDLQMQQPQEAAAKAEAERHR